LNHVRCETLLQMGVNLVFFNPIILNAFYIFIICKLNSKVSMTTNHSFQLRPNWVVQLNMVSQGMDIRFVMIG